MKGWLFPYGPWYALAAFGALVATFGVTSGDILTPAWCGLVAAVIAARLRVLRWRV
jgi:hypothetical protein